ncbi:sensor histidine kinase, partial [Blautia wexlerae]|nr:sensor histidine kinase [Blautia wexlerae]
MLKRYKAITDRARHALKRRSIQFTISISFTMVAVAGMILVAAILSARFISSSEQMVSEDNRRMLNQVNLNLDNYLHNMMKVSDSMYYRVIKNVDLSSDLDKLTQDMRLLYETNRDLLVSVAVFTDSGEVIAAEPLSQLKFTVDPKSQDWF